MTDHLETFPEAPVSMEIDEYRLEVVRLKDNMIATAKTTRRELPNSLARLQYAYLLNLTLLLFSSALTPLSVQRAQ